MRAPMRTFAARTLLALGAAALLAAAPIAGADPAVRAYVGNCVQELNGQLNRWETIKDFRILDHDLTVEGDELTPSMKLKRKVLESRYASLLDSMYGG